MTTTPLPPTPRCDAEVYESGPTAANYGGINDPDVVVDYTFAQQLERELIAADQARADLEAENKRLRDEIDNLRKEALEPPTNKTHRCIKCLHAYSVGDGDNEDCPACGHDGTALEQQP